MPFPAITDPVAGTVITAAWEIANPLAAIRWLRQLMGNTDPPGASYVVVASGPGAAAWSKIPADALAPGAVVAHLTYTPVNKAGDTMTGILTAPGFQAGASGVNGGTGGVNGSTGGVNGGTGGFSGGSTTAGVPQMLGAIVGASGVSVTGLGGVNVVGGAYRGGDKTLGASLNLIGLNIGVNGIVCDGAIQPGSYGGGTIAVGVPQMLGAIVGASGVSVTGLGGIGVTGGGSVAVSGGGGVHVSGGGTIDGGSKTVGTDLLVMGLQVGVHGILSDAQIASSVAAGAPFTAVSAAVCTGVNADKVDGADANVTAAPGRIPIAGASGQLDPGWIPSSGLAGVPSGAVLLWSGPTGNDGTNANIPAGWARFLSLDGRVPVGAGTSAAVTWNANTQTGSSWTHAHLSNSFSVSVTGSANGGPSDNVGAATGAGYQANTSTPNTPSALQTHIHPLNGVSLAVSATGFATGNSATAAWDFPAYAAIYIRKS